MCEDWFGWQKSCYERREGGEGVMRGRYEKLLWGGFDERALWEIVMRGCDVLVCVSDRS